MTDYKPHPLRIHRKRTKGWRMPDGAVYVGRPSRWGNPYRAGDDGIPDAAAAVEAYSRLIVPYRHSGPAVHSKLVDYLLSESELKEIRRMLRGKLLACWCPLDKPCHADVLAALANE